MEMERKFIGDSTPGWRWCLDARCDGGQVHKPLIAKLERLLYPKSESPAKRGKNGKVSQDG
jgi:hypothetical protein